MIAEIFARARSLWRAVARGRALDAEMNDDFHLHMELRAADLVKSGLSPAEAERRARAEFGGAYNYTQAGREARGLRWFDALRFSWLDFKLGGRMLARYPGLTVVASIAMGVAIALGGGVLGAFALLRDPALPLDEGDRIVGIQMWNTADNSPERQILHDFAAWRAELRSVRELSAFRTIVGNMVTPDGGLEPTRAVAMSASGFRVARVPPFLGRFLVDADERPDAPLVAVIGYDLWRGRFAADSGIVGRMVRLGTASHTIVGVMPPGFAYPVNYTLWVPLRADPLQHKRGDGPALYLLGRLAPGASLQDARAELSVLGARAAREFPETHATLRARVLPFAQSWFDFDSPEMVLAYRSMQLLVTLLLVVICSHVAILVYARTAMRQSEMTLRTALGASRARIVAQLFGEALALSATSSAIGLAIIWGVSSQLEALLMRLDVDFLPFWISLELSAATVGWVIALAVLGAFIIGVIPALQVTGRGVGSRLQSLVGGHATVRLGRTWTAIIVAEVALTVAALPFAVRLAWDAVDGIKAGPGFAAEQYLSASLAMDRNASVVLSPADQRALLSQFARSRDELVRRLEAEKDVADVTSSARPPGSESGMWVQIDAVEPRPAGSRAPADGGRWGRVRVGRVDVDFFAAFDVPVIAGRGFSPADADSASKTVIVNRSLVDTLFQGRNAIGRRLRPMTVRGKEEIPGPWYEIVGVVDDFPKRTGFDASEYAVYHAAPPDAYPVTLSVRMRGTDPVTFAGRLRAIAADVQPALQLSEIRRLDDVVASTHLPAQLIALGLATVTLSVLILSAAGIYALMSVTVTRRRREIGIRVALGAGRGRVLSSVFARAGAQLAGGVMTALGAIALLDAVTEGEVLGPRGAIILAGVSLVMMTVGVIAALGPARRGLSVQPTIALREE